VTIFETGWTTPPAVVGDPIGTHPGRIMTAIVALSLALATVGAAGDRATLVGLGGDPARGVLVNRSPGSRPYEPPDPSRLTVVFIHGVNPLPRTVHFTMAERLAEAIAGRFGPGAFNVLDWNWNAATLVSHRHAENSEAAVSQGVLLAESLRSAGIAPSRLHLIGHSAGSMVAASAARAMADSLGERPAQLTFLDPAGFYHEILFDRLAAGSAAGRVENCWAAGPSGYGRASRRAGVVDVRVVGRTPFLGVVAPTRSGHLDIVRWYVATAADPTCPHGFNASVLIPTP
jgi:pimeloyl-ACP methyl ester carboxylesterase